MRIRRAAFAARRVQGVRRRPPRRCSLSALSASGWFHCTTRHAGGRRPSLPEVRRGRERMGRGRSSCGSAWMRTLAIGWRLRTAEGTSAAVAIAPLRCLWCRHMPPVSATPPDVPVLGPLHRPRRRAVHVESAFPGGSPSPGLRPCARSASMFPQRGAGAAGLRHQQRLAPPGAASPAIVAGAVGSRAS